MHGEVDGTFSSHLQSVAHIELLGCSSPSSLVIIPDGRNSDLWGFTTNANLAMRRLPRNLRHCPHHLLVTHFLLPMGKGAVYHYVHYQLINYLL